MRTTTLRDAHTGRADGSPPQLISPLPHWGTTEEVDGVNGNAYIPGIQNIEDTGGYSIFAEKVPHPAPAAWSLALSPGTAETSGAYITTGTFAESAGHTTNWNRYTVRVSISSGGRNSPDHGCRGCATTFTNGGAGGTGASVDVAGVMFWNKGDRLYLWPDTLTDVAALNAAFPPGSTIVMSNTPVPSKPVEDNLALAFVYGRNAERSAVVAGPPSRNYFSGASSAGKARVRHGGTSQAYAGGRDYTVFTINWFAPVKPGYTYYNRQYVIADRFSDMDSISRAWQGEASQGMYFPGDTLPNERTVYIYSEGSLFGPSLNQTCGRPLATVACTGKSTPHTGAVPKYAITCAGGASKYFGTDPYALSPSRTAFSPSAQAALRPYLCDGQASSVRPVWTLLGFFLPSACSELEGGDFNSGFCIPVAPVTFSSVGPCAPNCGTCQEL